MTQTIRESLESFAAVALAGVFCWTAVALAPTHHLPHLYPYGAVAWNCGPGFEIAPTPGFFWEGEC